VDSGSDAQYGRFNKSGDAKKIQTPPFYAMQFFPMTRKSMGGISIDSSAQAVDRENRPIPGLYAAGESAGLAGINGRAALEGTFLGPSVLTGRIAARAAVATLHLAAASATAPTVRAAITPAVAPTEAASSAECVSCHNIKSLVNDNRAGYWHFERVHRVVIERNLECSSCHARMSTRFDIATHKVDRLAQSYNCQVCHGAP